MSFAKYDDRGNKIVGFLAAKARSSKHQARALTLHSASLWHCARFLCQICLSPVRRFRKLCLCVTAQVARARDCVSVVFSPDPDSHCALRKSDPVEARVWPATSFPARPPAETASDGSATVGKDRVSPASQMPRNSNKARCIRNSSIVFRTTLSSISPVKPCLLLTIRQCVLYTQYLR